MGNATALNPTFSTVTAGDLDYLDTTGNAVNVSVETQLGTLTSTMSSCVSKNVPIFNGTPSIGMNSINLTNVGGYTHTIDRTILESLYTNCSLWKTSYPVVDLSPYVTTASLTSTLGNYVLSTALTSNVTSTSLTTTMANYELMLTTALGSYMPKTGGTFPRGIYPWMLIV